VIAIREDRAAAAGLGVEAAGARDLEALHAARE